MIVLALVVPWAIGCSSGAGAKPDGGGGGGGGDDASQTNDAPVETAPPPMPRFAFDWNGVVGTGQSLSVGGLGTPILGTAPSFNNLKLALGGATVPPFDDTLAALMMAPLNEPIRPTDPGYPSPYPRNLDGETPHTAMATQITTMVQAVASKDYVTVHTVVGESGQGIPVIRKGAVDTGATGRAYAATLFEARAIKRIASDMNKTYGIGAIIITHGESDAGNMNYANDLFQLWSDYNADLKAITGQTASIPMLVSQQNSVPSAPNSGSVSAVQQWKVGVDHPGDIICIGPKYQYLQYRPDTNGYIHLSALGYERLGEKFGEVYYEKVVLGNDWQPLQPISATIDANVITVRFHVPVPPLVWDDTLPQPHPTGAWAMGRGFEVTAASAPATIDSVEIVGDDTVVITCRDSLAGSAVVLGYAALAAPTALPGGGTYRWGHLRDSDAFMGAMTQTAQPNYGVTFQTSVPF